MILFWDCCGGNFSCFGSTGTNISIRNCYRSCHHLKGTVFYTIKNYWKYFPHKSKQSTDGLQRYLWLRARRRKLSHKLWEPWLSWSMRGKGWATKTLKIWFGMGLISLTNTKNKIIWAIFLKSKNLHLSSTISIMVNWSTKKPKRNQNQCNNPLRKNSPIKIRKRSLNKFHSCSLTAQKLTLALTNSNKGSSWSSQRYFHSCLYSSIYRISISRAHCQPSNPTSNKLAVKCKLRKPFFISTSKISQPMNISNTFVSWFLSWNWIRIFPSPCGSRLPTKTNKRSVWLTWRNWGKKLHLRRSWRLKICLRSSLLPILKHFFIEEIEIYSR